LTESAPKYRTGWLWGILLLFSTGGIIGGIYVVWGASSLVLTHQYLLYVPITIAAAVVTGLCVLFTSGILYKVDRLRGVAHREVALFE
jgi:heme A synthase